MVVTEQHPDSLLSNSDVEYDGDLLLSLNEIYDVSNSP